MKIEVTFVCL